MVATFTRISPFAVYYWSVVIGAFLFFWHRSGYSPAGFERGTFAAFALAGVMVLTIAIWKDESAESKRGHDG